MSNDSAKAGGGGLPVVFLAASAIAYFNMPEIGDSVTRLVAAGSVGLGASAGGGLGVIAGGLSGYFGGRALDRNERYAAPLVGAVAGVLIGGGVGVYQGYDMTKGYVLDFIKEMPSQSERMNGFRTGEVSFNIKGKPATYDYYSNRVYLPA